MINWEGRRARWEAYMKGIRDKKAGREPSTSNKSYLEGYNETREHKIRKYS